MHPSAKGVAATHVEMPRYQSHKQVHALKILAVDRAADGLSYWITFEEQMTYAPIKVAGDIFARYFPQPGDYYVVYEDGYKSISPAKAFEEGYTRL